MSFDKIFDLTASPWSVFNFYNTLASCFAVLQNTEIRKVLDSMRLPAYLLFTCPLVLGDSPMFGLESHAGTFAARALSVWLVLPVCVLVPKNDHS